MAQMDSDAFKAAEGLLDLQEVLMPLVEAAEGFKKTLMDRGWPEEYAWAGASYVLNGMVAGGFGIANQIKSSDE